MEFLASDAMQGRGSGSHDEQVAATYIASEMRAFGIAPGNGQSYIQAVPLLRRKLSAPPVLKLGADASLISWSYGDDFVAARLSQPGFSGPLQKIRADAALKDDTQEEPMVTPGAVVLVMGGSSAAIRRAAFGAASAGAAGVLIAGRKEDFAEGNKLPQLPARFQGSATPDMGGDINVLQLSEEAMARAQQAADGTQVSLEAPSRQEPAYTWNAVGIIPGADPTLKQQAILFSAHLDHVGIGQPVNGDAIYNGADDDASGVTAVLEIARVLGQSSKPRRTVIFAFFGSEENGGMGATYFREHPPVPLPNIVANLEFEMLGRPDPKVPANTLWLTGWERSNLGATLAQHGARLVQDPRPDQDFFARSDNYVLAKKGVVAHTISSFGLHAQYHQPSDDLEHINFPHMNSAIGSLLGPVRWLVNSGFTPQWKDGGRP
jgi:hypothetical protein